jgi:transposase
MRGTDGVQEGMFSFSKLEDFVPSDHPLRAIAVLVNEALKGMNSLFNSIYADTGRASIAPEKLLRAMLLQVLFSVRSERQLMEQVRYNMLYRWFIGLAIDDEVWNHSVFSKNRDRLLDHAVVERFFTEVMQLADKRGLLSKEHFSVDGTLIQAWASHKSFVRKDGSSDDDGGSGTGGRNALADWKGKPRSNTTHASTTDPDARLFRKSKSTAAILAFQGHVLMEHRSGLVVGAVVTHADGFGERKAALAMLDTVPGAHAKTVAADKAYDTRDFVAACRQRGVTPHVARNMTHQGRSAIDALRLGQDRRAHPTNRLPRAQASRPALQADHDREQRHPNGSNAGRSAARCNDMKTRNDPQALHTAAQDARTAAHEPATAFGQLASVASAGSSVANSTAC